MPCLDRILYISHCRSTKYCNTWNLIRKRMILIPCQSYSVGEFTCTFCFEKLILLCYFHCSIILICFLWFVLTVVTGMEANVDMFTSSFDPRDLCHHMILLINMLMQMHKRSIFTSLQKFHSLVPADLFSACICFSHSWSLSYSECSGLATEIIGVTYVELISYGFLIQTDIGNY